MFKILLLFLLIITLSSCQKNTTDEIKIGFVAGLTGKYSSTSVKIRDGFMLAFHEINYKINNKKVIIIQKDDKQDPKIAKEIAKYFIKNNIKLIVGNATSSMTNITLNQIKNKNDFLLASVTASSRDFSNKDDNFIRTQVADSQKQYDQLSLYLKKNSIKKVVYIYDKNNINYVNGFFEFFQDMLIKSGGIKFVATNLIQDKHQDIIDKLNSISYDMILIVANSSDTANLIQRLKINNINKQIMISQWANTSDFIEFGGKAIENVIVNTAYSDESRNNKFLHFKNKFKEFYKTDASIYEAKGYEMAKILIENLKKTTDISKLKDEIINGKTYNGLQGNIIFNKYGDTNKKYFVMKLINGKFIKINNF